MADKEKETFEESLGRLEKIVAKMEHGEVALEESLGLFEEGVGLGRKCHAFLEAADQKISRLTLDPQGKASLEPFEADAEGETG